MPDRRVANYTRAAAESVLAGAPYTCEVCGRRTSSIYRLVYSAGDVWACGACADLREDGSDE